MKYILGAIVGIIAGCLLVAVPTGTKYVQVKYECSDEVCLGLDSSGEDKSLRGFPLKSTEIVEENGYYKSEKIVLFPAAVDFAIGFVLVGGTAILIVNKRASTSRSK